MVPEPAEATAPPPYGLGRMLEDTLTAPLRPKAVFAARAAEPAPGFGLMLANLLVFWSAMFAVNLLRALASYPAEVLRHGAGTLAAVGFCALALAVLMSFFAASLFHALCQAAGGQGGYARSYQIVSLLSALAPLQALAGGLPALWAAPTVLGAFLTVVAVEKLHGASALRTRLIFPGMAAFFLLSAWAVRAQLEKRLPSVQAAAPRAPELERAADAPTPALSGLDLLKVPEQAAAGAPAPRQLEEMQKSGAKMLDAALPLLQDPALTKGMPPEQAKQVRELAGMVSRLQKDIKDGKTMTPEQSEAMLKMARQLGQQGEEKR